MEWKADYSIQFVAPSGSQLDLLSTQRIVSFTYTRILNDIGTFQLTIDANDNAAQYFGLLDLVVNVYRRNQPMGDLELDASYLTRYWERLEDDESGEEYIIFSGYSLEHLLFRRHIDFADDPVNAGGFVTRQGSGDTVMRDFVLYQCITPAVNLDRAFTGLTAAAVSGGYQQTFQRRSTENLLDILKEIVQKSNVDFRVVYTGDAPNGVMSMEFQATTIGTDRTKTTNYPTSPYLLFDPRRGNMFSPSVVVDRKDEKTFVYVTGQGLEDERVIFPVINAQAATDSIWNRIETVVDARNNQENDTDGYFSAGIDTLNDNKALTEFNFQPDLAVIRYNVGFFLGDKITGQYEGYQKDVRIKAVTISIENDETISIELSNEFVI